MSKAKTPKAPPKPVDPIAVREKALKDTYTLMVYAAIDDLNAAVTAEHKQFQSPWFVSYTNLTVEREAYSPKYTPITVCNPEIPQVFRQIMDTVTSEIAHSKGTEFAERIDGTQDGSLCKIASRIDETSLKGQVLEDAGDYRSALLASMGNIERTQALQVVAVMFTYIKGFARVAASALWHGSCRNKKATISTSMLFDWLSDKFTSEEQHYRCTIHTGMRPKAKKATPEKQTTPSGVPPPPQLDQEVPVSNDETPLN